MSGDLGAGIGRTRPFELLEEEVHLAILRTAAVLEHAFGQALKPYGITQTQYNVLRILRGAGAGGLCRSEIAARLIRPVPDVTRLLDRLTEMGLIGRRRSDVDRRLVRSGITVDGLDLLARLDGPMADIHRQRLAHVDQQTLRVLADSLALVRQSAAADPSSRPG
jgi:DNA-binding MarR family transcriptional regulator